MIDESTKDKCTYPSPSRLQKNNSNSKIIQEKLLFKENINHCPLNVFDLFGFLSSNIKDSDSGDIENCLLEILKEINNDVNIAQNYFEPLLIILQNFTDYSWVSVDTVLRIIYNLMTLPSQKKKDYFQFFTQPIFLEQYFNLVTLDDQSINVITEIVRKKSQILEIYNEQIQLIILQTDLSEPLFKLLLTCLKINPEFVPTEEISPKLDEILKSNSSLFSSSAELARKIIKYDENSVEFFAGNAIYYLNIENDDIENINLIKLYTEIVKMTKDFSFLFLDSNHVFIDFLALILNSKKSDDYILSPLLKFLSHEANVSCFIEYPQIINTSLTVMDTFSFNDQKKLLNFILNIILLGDKDLLELSIKSGFMRYLSVFMENCSDSKMTMKMLTVLGLIFENTQISVTSEICEYIENFMYSENEEISNLSSAAYQKMMQREMAGSQQK